jgi:uncharacterized protein YodC (DUF2158 family)
MTVENVESHGVSCMWFEGKKVQRETFAAGTLKTYDPPSAFMPSRG